MYFLIGKWIDFLTHEKNEYGTRDIISHGLHIFYPIFQCGLESKAVNITVNLCTKQGYVSLKSAVYNQDQILMSCVRNLTPKMG